MSLPWSRRMSATYRKAMPSVLGETTMGYYKFDSLNDVTSVRPIFTTELLGASCRSTLATGETVGENIAFKLFPREKKKGDIAVVRYRIIASGSWDYVMIHITPRDGSWWAAENPYELKSLVAPDKVFQIMDDGAFVFRPSDKVLFSNKPESLHKPTGDVHVATISDMLKCITDQISVDALLKRSLHLAREQRLSAELTDTRRRLREATSQLTRSEKHLAMAEARVNELQGNLSQVRTAVTK